MVDVKSALPLQHPANSGLAFSPCRRDCGLLNKADVEK